MIQNNVIHTSASLVRAMLVANTCARNQDLRCLVVKLYLMCLLTYLTIPQIKKCRTLLGCQILFQNFGVF